MHPVNYRSSHQIVSDRSDLGDWVPLGFGLKFVFCFRICIFYLNLYVYFFLFVHTVNYKSSDQIASARSDLRDCAVSADWRGRSHPACHICIEIKENSYFYHKLYFVLEFVFVLLFICALCQLLEGAISSCLPYLHQDQKDFFWLVFWDLMILGQYCLHQCFWSCLYLSCSSESMWKFENVENQDKAVQKF